MRFKELLKRIWTEERGDTSIPWYKSGSNLEKNISAIPSNISTWWKAGNPTKIPGTGVPIPKIGATVGGTGTYSAPVNPFVAVIPSTKNTKANSAYGSTESLKRLTSRDTADTGEVVDVRDGMYLGADGVWRDAEDNHNYVNGLGKYAKKSGGGGSSSVAGFPTYTVPQVNLNIPDFAWNPTEEQRGSWEEQAANRAGLIIDPQRQQEIEALESFKQNVTKQIGEINPRYTKMSLAIANVVDNTIKQDIIDELIRRGATTSGEMERQLEGAGRFEVEQRGNIEGERNQLINALNLQEQQRGTQSSDRLAELERLRGMTTAEELFQEEKYQRGMTNAEKQSLFQAELSKAGLIDQQQARAYESDFQRALFEAQMGHL